MDEKESVIQKKLITALEESFEAIYIRKIHQSQYSHAGIPDLLGSLRGEFFGIEVKTLKGRVSKLQERELQFITESGGLALICRGSEDIQRIIDELRLWT